MQNRALSYRVTCEMEVCAKYHGSWSRLPGGVAI